MNRVQHDLEQSESGAQVFWLEIYKSDWCENDAWEQANMRAWLAMGYDDFDDYEKLSSYKKGKFNAILNQATLLEEVRMAYGTGEVKWLIKQGATVEVYPFGWLFGVEPPEPKIIVRDDNIAAMFKLTWGGAQ